MSLRVLQPRVRASATTIVQLYGAPPLRAVTWAIVSGLGTIEPLSTVTDETGSAWAVYDPDGNEGAAVIGVDYGA